MIGKREATDLETSARGLSRLASVLAVLQEANSTIIICMGGRCIIFLTTYLLQNVMQSKE